MGSNTSCTLVLGGISSGKSSFAVQKALELAGDDAVFLATAREGQDKELNRRIQRHRNNRPETWSTVEPPYDFLDTLDSLLDRREKLILLDDYSLLVSDWMEDGKEVVIPRTEKFLSTIEQSNKHWLIVSQLAGRSPVPANSTMRQFLNLLGRVNQKIASVARQVHEITAGVNTVIKDSSV